MIFSAGILARPVQSFQRLTFKRFTHELAPRFKVQKKKQKGRIAVRTGGSAKGSLVSFGSYGIRLKSEGVRMAAVHLKEADNVITKCVREYGGKVWRRLCTNIAICTKGNETRMGKGKGPFDYWAVRVPTGKVIFEVSGDSVLHEKIAREAFRKAGEKMPGTFEFVKKGGNPRLGLKDAIKPLPPKQNFLAQYKANPDKKLLNVLKSRDPVYKLYSGRS
ncbi:unnamed protein product [Kuraishia capsulata CBS 1993]|uniref:Uncharacterized protein n=1 Tax=Kuraishia capsulata CBS 1993 TaxID=1382522 RepID=W6MGC7_9ASCO|nr:uncharacterized protein KUCA_T00000808001 [Kuraishia capsulata CBS 1993]CDK24841.1 unnamed protein product [Kuraishia capsulata CBS 1993]